ncbi:MAG: four-carbon acid sugar kinase family protein [Bacillota bacterium]
MIKLMIIADDITGAIDTGVQFSKKGVHAFVTTELNVNFKELDSSIEVLIVDTESRHINAVHSYRRVYDIVKDAVQNGIRNFYKKTDSMLRGNIGAELTALLHASKAKQLSFIPAYPQINRITCNGNQIIDGIPLEQTAHAKDPFNPVSTSNISQLIKQQSNVNVRLVKSSDYEQAFKGNYELPEIVLFDAGSVEEMGQIGKMLKDENKFDLVAGCAGFAEVLAELFHFNVKKEYIKKRAEKVLIISGSLNSVSIDQIEFAQSKGVKGHKLTSEQKLDSKYMFSEEGDTLIRRICDGLIADGHYIITVASGQLEKDEAKEYALKKRLPIESLNMQIARNIGFLVKRILETVEIDALVVFGGDTLMGIMEKLGCKGITPHKEILSGVVVSDIVSEGHKFQIVSKSGSFGGRDVIFEILSFLRA